MFVFGVDVRPKHPEGGQNCLGSRSGGGLRFLRADGKGLIGGGEGSHEPPSKKRGSEGKSSGDFPGVGGPREKKKRQQARELELFFLSPRIPLVDTPVTVAEVGRAKRQCPHGPLAAAAKASIASRTHSRNGTEMARAMPVTGPSGGVGKSWWGQCLPDTAPAATLWLVRNSALRDYHRVGTFFFSFLLTLAI